MASRGAGAPVTHAVRERARRPMSATERKKVATGQLLKALAAADTDKERAITAALEAVSERLDWDATLRQRISEKYGELTELSAARSNRSRASSGPAPKPISTSGPARGRTFERLDPYRVLEDFGRDKLREMLARDTQGRLRTAVAIVQERHPRSKLPNRSRIEDMVNYIVEYVAGQGY